MNYLWKIIFCFILFTPMTYAADATSVVELNTQIQEQIKGLQDQQQQQLATLNTQLQAQIQKMQTDLQKQIQTVNSQTQEQMKQIQADLQKKIAELQKQIPIKN